MLKKTLGLVLLSCLGCGGGSNPSTPSTPTPTGAAVGTPVANEGWLHVPEGSVVTYRNNPPASGSHYPVWARYQEHASAVARPYWVHNLEHGAIVLLYRPDAPAATVSALQAAYRSLPVDSACGHTRALLTPDPLLLQPVAAVAADFVLLADSVDAQAIRDFTAAHRGHGPEAECANGTRP